MMKKFLAILLVMAVMMGCMVSATVALDFGELPPMPSEPGELPPMPGEPGELPSVPDEPEEPEEPEDPAVVASGYCGGEGDGTNLTWTLDKNGLLTISGSGKMEDYTSSGAAPWLGFDRGLEVTIGKEVTTIGDYAFSGCYDLIDMVVPSGVISLGDGAFYNCSNLKAVYFEGDAPNAGENVFDEHTTLYYIPGTTGWTGSHAYDAESGTWNGYQLEVWGGIAVSGKQAVAEICVARDCKAVFTVYDSKGKFVKCELRDVAAGRTEWEMDLTGTNLTGCSFQVLLLENETSANPWAALCPAMEYSAE